MKKHFLCHAFYSKYSVRLCNFGNESWKEEVKAQQKERKKFIFMNLKRIRRNGVKCFELAQIVVRGRDIPASCA
jgi:hypothetical protein